MASTVKAEKDYSGILNEQLPSIEKLYQENPSLGLEKLVSLEKQVRQASDLDSSKRVLSTIVQLLVSHQKYEDLSELIMTFSKKHGQFKDAIQSMIQEFIKHLDDMSDEQTKVKVLESILAVTENKIHLEVERARVSKKMSDLLYSKGDLDGAAKVLCELQVETFGSMELKEKISFILDQMKLCNERGDFSFAKILSRKILVRSLDSFPDFKLRYYNLMIETAEFEDDYLNIVKYYMKNYELVAEMSEKLEILTRIVYYVVLSPFDNLKNDLINKVKLDRNLSKLPCEKELVRLFITMELINLKKFSADTEFLKQSEVFSGAKGAKHSEDLQQRIIEHNLIVISKYYNYVSLDRLCELLQLSQQSVEENLINLVNTGLLFVKINRPMKVVQFHRAQSESDIINDWSSKVETLLEDIEVIEHLINKEEMMNVLKETKLTA